MHKCTTQIKRQTLLSTRVIRLVLLIISCATGSSNTSAQSSNGLDVEVKYGAKDLQRMDIVKQKVYLHKEAYVHYKNMKLTADYIEIDLRKNLAKAKYVLDSAGNKIGRPTFKDAQQEFVCDEMIYNFKTQRGRIIKVRTQEAEGYLLSDTNKRHENEHIHIKGAHYTTCDLEEPHFYFRLSKAIVIPEDKIISGPLNLWISDFPTPLGLPFGFFPNNKRGSNGILLPTYGESPGLGFFLQNLGYYHRFGSLKEKRRRKKGLPIEPGTGDYVDMSLLGDVYSRGSWALKSNFNYRRRYKSNGNLSLSYSSIHTSEREFPDYNKTNQFAINWRHTQDQKANPNGNFSANVQINSQQNFRQNLNTTTDNYLKNTYTSSIAYRRTFPGKPFNVNFKIGHSQNNINRKVNLILPQAQFSLNRMDLAEISSRVFNVQPTRKKWFHKIGISYNTFFLNDITIADSLLNLHDISWVNKHMRTGMRHNLAASNSVKLLNKKVTFNPSIAYAEYWYLKEIEKYWDDDIDGFLTDTINGFARGGNYTLNGSFTTKLYGLYAFADKFRGARAARFRQVITPTMGFRYNPKWKGYRWGYYGQKLTYAEYSPFAIGNVGTPGGFESGSMYFKLMNALEMKYNSASDTTGDPLRTVKIIDNFNISSAYDFFRDSLRLSNFNFVARTNFLKNLVSFNLTGQIDPYHYTKEGTRINTLEYLQTRKLGHLTNVTGSVGTNFKSKNQNRKDNKFPAHFDPINNNNLEEFVDYNVPWSLGLMYSISYNRRNIGTESDTGIYVQSLAINGNVNITNRWRIRGDLRYDFQAKDFSYASFNIYRDLHCWELAFQWIPFGNMKSYNFSINVKASALKDLRYRRRRNWYDNDVIPQ